MISRRLMGILTRNIIMIKIIIKSMLVSVL